MSAASPYPTDAEAKAQIIEAGLKIYQRGLVAANDGNLSVRVGENALWVTPTGVSKGFMTEDMLVKLDLDGNVLAGTRKASSETKMHLRIYQENPDVRAVVHAHPPAATAFAAAGIPLDRPVLQEAVVQLGTVPVAPFALPGSQGVADSVAPLLPGLPRPAAGVSRGRHLGRDHGAGLFPPGVPGADGQRDPPSQDPGLRPGHAGGPGEGAGRASSGLGDPVSAASLFAFSPKSTSFFQVFFLFHVLFFIKFLQNHRNLQKIMDK